ncbi:cytochrome P450 [Streptomyces sp. NPDC090025]|uniref:cytochrome P450 family protein n=1 Tax=Streptomyces sp. NPDC090025 TaxID=3365922 RepID=UPI003835253C
MTSSTTGPATATTEEPFVLDPFAVDRHDEHRRLLAAGPLVRVEMPGGVRAWSVTRQEVAKELLTDQRFVKDINHWGAWRRGEVPAGWPLIGAVTSPRSVVTVDGADHRRLRSYTAAAFTVRRVEALRPRITEITEGLLGRLVAEHTADEVVDLKDTFAFPLPMSVIGSLFGLTQVHADRLRGLYDSLFSSITSPEETLATLASLQEFYLGVIADRRANPGDDLTSALIGVNEDGDRLSDVELRGTLGVMVAAGHETTVNLLVSAVRALCLHRDQLELVRAGEATWEAVVEETLRWASPVNNFLFRYATEDVEVAGRVIGKGEPVLMSYGAMGHATETHGPDADRFDITRTGTRHISFGHGPHICPGSHLARMEAAIALPALFDRFPDLDLAVPASALVPNPTVALHSYQGLPVRLGRAAGH